MAQVVDLATLSDVLALQGNDRLILLRDTAPAPLDITLDVLVAYVALRLLDLGLIPDRSTAKALATYL